MIVDTRTLYTVSVNFARREVRGIAFHSCSFSLDFLNGDQIILSGITTECTYCATDLYLPLEEDSFMKGNESLEDTALMFIDEAKAHNETVCDTTSSMSSLSSLPTRGCKIIFKAGPLKMRRQMCKIYAIVVLDITLHGAKDETRSKRLATRARQPLS